MTKFVLSFDCDNAAFDEGARDERNCAVDTRAEETARILRDVAQRILHGSTSGNVRDINGNTVGTFQYTRADAAPAEAPLAERDCEAVARAGGFEARHDMHGYYVLTAEEAAYEDDGHASVGFDGRLHFAALAMAWEVAADMAEGR